MKKKTIVGSIIALAMLVGAAFSGTIFAAAASDFGASVDNGANEGAGYASGRTETEITKALNAKVDSLNEAIGAVEGKTLAQAYEAGEIQAYSNRNDGMITGENKRSSFKTWDGRPVLDLKYMNDGYDGWGDNSVGWLSYNGVTDEGVIIIGQFARCYEKNGKLGAPLADKVRVTDADGYVEYQNYANGYMKSVKGAACTVVEGKNVEIADDGTVSEIAADTNAAGYVGAATKAILEKAGMSSQAFAKAFGDAYTYYKTEKDFDVGYSFSMVQTKYGNTSQDFRYGDSASSPWGGDRSNWAFLAYNYEQGKVYLIRDEFQYVFENGGKWQNAAKALGDPAGDDFVVGSKRYQNFSKGYMIADGVTGKNANIESIVTGKNMGADGNEIVLDAYSRVGKLGISAIQALPETFNEETFSAEIKRVYDATIKLGNELESVDLVQAADGVIYQEYTDKSGKIHALVYDAAAKTFRYLSPAVYTKFTANSGGLGLPTAERMQVAATENKTIYVYPFATGYIKLAVSEQSDIDDEGNEITVMNESAVVTMGARYDAEQNFFETISYADRITAKIVNDSVKNAYAFLNVPAAEELATLFREAYIAAFEKGFSAGEPASEGITWWTTGNSGVVKLTLKGGNGNANFWGDNTLMTYDPVSKSIHIVTGDIANIYASDGASGNGWATTDMMINTKTGVIVQQFDIHDSVVESRPVYIISDGKQTKKVSGTYDFEVNKGEGEWVEYITQFGGSISAKPVEVASSYAVNQPIDIDFSKFLGNADNYDVTYTLTSAQGTLSEAGVFTLTPTATGKITVTVEARSAFDKLTLSAELNVVSDTPVDPDPEDPEDPEKPESGKKGCNGSIAAGTAVGGAILLIGAAAALMLRRKKQDR